jgi:hypothetical protein
MQQRSVQGPTAHCVSVHRAIGLGQVDASHERRPKPSPTVSRTRLRSVWQSGSWMLHVSPRTPLPVYMRPRARRTGCAASSCSRCGATSLTPLSCENRDISLCGTGHLRVSFLVSENKSQPINGEAITEHPNHIPSMITNVMMPTSSSDSWT